MYLAERDEERQDFASYADALWWGVVSITDALWWGVVSITIVNYLLISPLWLGIARIFFQ